MKYLFKLILILQFSLVTGSENELPGLYKTLLPSVVTLHTFQNTVGKNQTKIATTPTGLGSGVIVSADGLIATASHVVHSADSVHVEFTNGIRKLGKVISTLPAADLALIKVEELPDSAVVTALGSSDDINIGEQVFVIGAPLGLSRTLTVGYISGIHPVGSRSNAPMAEFFQTDAALNPGNSGGPLFNMNGEVIGIASHIQSQTGGSQGLGFAATSKSVKELLLDRSRVWSGVEIFPLTYDMAKVFHLPSTSGVLIQRVATNSLAHKAGIRGGKYNATIEGKPVVLGGDILLSINGFEFDSNQSIEQIMKSLENVTQGKTLTFDVWRKGKRQIINYTVKD